MLCKTFSDAVKLDDGKGDVNNWKCGFWRLKFCFAKLLLMALILMTGKVLFTIRCVRDMEGEGVARKARNGGDAGVRTSKAEAVARSSPTTKKDLRRSLRSFFVGTPKFYLTTILTILFGTTITFTIS